jgi:glycosyltransferase involved in cell wall biosynthesis
MKLGLIMIVKNESAIIKRCMDRVKGIIDFVVITDTGSTDNTVEVIENYLADNNIEGKICHCSFKNFGYNRTVSFNNALDFVISKSWDRNDCYGLLLDADMELIILDSFKKEDVKHQVCNVVQKDFFMRWANVRVINMGLDWKCLGVTHEYWSSDFKEPSIVVDTLHINDVGDGGCKDDKLERDVRLLLNGLIEEPNNERYMFYLANTYRCMKKYNDAIRWYQKRIDAGGWDEERWYSIYQQSLCYRDLGKFNKFQLKALEAYNARPMRVEPLYHLAREYRLKGINHLAYLFSKIGMQTPENGDALFIENGPRLFGFMQEMSISGYYNEFSRDDAKRAVNQLLITRNIPIDVRGEAENNIIFYLDKLPATHNELKIITPPIKPGLNYRQMNTSVTECGNLAIVRTVNYDQEKCSYTIHDDQQIVKTRNFLLNLQRYHKSGVTFKEDIIELMENEKTRYNYERYTHHIIGLEDSRIFLHKNRIWFTCTLTDANKEFLPKIGLCRVDGKWDRKKLRLIGCTGAIESIYLLEGPDPNRCEKNWLPYSKDGEIYLIYGYQPFKIYKVTKEFKLEIHIESNVNFELSSMRGSASPIKVDNHYLIIIHQVLMVNGSRVYVHRFMMLDNKMSPVSISKPFYLLEKDIEFIMGCYMYNDVLHITAGIKDRSTYMFHIHKKDLFNIIGHEEGKLQSV